jgi:uncharacterized protein
MRKPGPNAYAAELTKEREMRDRFMASHPESPFVDSRVEGFRGLLYFPIDPKLRVRATLERVDPPREAFLRTNRDGQLEARYLGDLTFRLDGQSLRLRVYHAGGGTATSVFVPFRDLTSGRESYGPGRYLTLELNPSDIYEVDFNRAFNPYCAYTPAYECGFPPAENDLPIEIAAGEKAWDPAKNPRTPNAAIRSLLPPPRTSPPPGRRTDKPGRPLSQRKRK